MNIEHRRNYLRSVVDKLRQLAQILHPMKILPVTTELPINPNRPNKGRYDEIRLRASMLQAGQFLPVECENLKDAGKVKQAMKMGKRSFESCVRGTTVFVSG